MAKENIYPYAVAKIRVYEKNLLTRQSYIQMAEAKTAEDSLRIMTEAGYGVQGAQDERGFEAMLTEKLAETYSLLKGLVPEERFVDVFLYKNDYHNLKVLIKAELTGADGSGNLIDGGTIPLPVLEKAVRERSFSAIPKTMGRAVVEAYDVYAKSRDGQAIDIILDKAAFVSMKETADESGNEFVKGYVAALADITNIKSFIRIRSMKKTVEAFKSVFVSGGYLSLGVFQSAFGTENPAAAFAATRYSSVSDAIGRGFTQFEKTCDDYIMSYVKSAKYQALTVEPLIAYLYAKESEVKILRIIMTGKINGIDSETIKERLRESYV